MSKKDITKKKKNEVIYDAVIDKNGLEKEMIIKIVLGVLVFCAVLFSILFL